MFSKDHLIVYAFWIYSLCFISNSATTLPMGTAACTTDTCLLFHPYCRNDGICSMEPSTCRNQCSCTSGFEGRVCQTPLENNANLHGNGDDDLPPFSHRNCSENFICVHGLCVQNTTFKFCDCESGWSGVFCDEEVTQSNTLLGTPLQGTFKQVPTLFGSFPTDSTDLPLVNSSLDPRFNVCMPEYEKRSENLRTCNSIIQCEYGVCTAKHVVGETFTGTEYTCTCDIGGRGLFCENTCCLDCGDNGYCDDPVNDTVIPTCQCRRDYNGDRCQYYTPPPVNVQIREVTWYLWVVGCCAGALLLLLLLLLLLPYLMWRNRVILIMKIVHYFQSYEDSDDKQWDAFVSYKADQIDEDFVVHHLYPKLEQEFGFKLCLHFRDFIPGETIANNIISAVEGSRRTILILTPRYIQSEFTKFEYQKAQHEMLQRKHRIIPVVLEDISDVISGMDKNLRGIIESVTYLEWPGGEESDKKMDKFWKRLRLSLPKKRDTSSSSLSSSSSSSSAVSSVSTVSSECTQSSLMSETIYSEMPDDDDDDDDETIEPMSQEEEQCIGQEYLTPSYMCLSEIHPPSSDSDSKVTCTNDHLEVNSNTCTSSNKADQQQSNLILSVDDLKVKIKDDLPESRQQMDGVSSTSGNIKQYIDLLDRGVDV